MIELTCRHCASAFSDDPNRVGPKRKYCSHQCGIAAWRVAHSNNTLPERPCAKCGTVFSGRNNSLYCSARCRRIASYTPVLIDRRSKGVREHADDLIAMYKAGSTLEQIGQKYNVTRERVRQIISQNGVTWKDGGAYQRHAARVAKGEARREERYMRRFGMGFAEYRSINNLRAASKGRSPASYYREQKRNAATRSIPFNLSFGDWWRIWSESGKWNTRGRGKGAACMSRYGDQGGYEIGNVYINTVDQNSREGRTRAYEQPRPRSLVYEVVQAAGGRKAVSQAAACSVSYVASLMNDGHLPKSWITDGRIQKLAELTAGAYSAEKIIELAVAA